MDEFNKTYHFNVKSRTKFEEDSMNFQNPAINNL